MIDRILFTVTLIQTLSQGSALTNASGFFFERGSRLYLVSSRHVFIDEPRGHFPDMVQIKLHTDSNNVTKTVDYAIPLYRNAESLWRQGLDDGGEIDVALIELDRKALPQHCVLHAFGPDHIVDASSETLEIGQSLLIPGFPLGFSDILHALPVVRHAIVASSFGMRFQGEGFFLTDARTHRGSSGAPVVMRPASRSDDALNWRLLGIHSSRLDVGTRNADIDEALGLNCAWYADVLMALTND